MNVKVGEDSERKRELKVNAVSSRRHWQDVKMGSEIKARHKSWQ